jgi:hypothetical protein
MMKKGSNVRWGNCIGFWLFPFSLKHFSDPLDRVRTAMKVSNRIKASFEGRFTFWFGTLVSKCGMPSVCLVKLNLLHSLLLYFCVLFHFLELFNFAPE